MRNQRSLWQIFKRLQAKCIYWYFKLPQKFIALQRQQIHIYELFTESLTWLKRSSRIALLPQSYSLLKNTASQWQVKTIFSPEFGRYVHPLLQIPLNLASQLHSSWSNRFWLKVIKSKDNSETIKNVKLYDC